ncbi:MAG: hypothetical protein HJJLKODD_00048 [Phycisphaerae bacterium]|nr:hypothetical protein [Phycisphaerae bacterium]
MAGSFLKAVTGPLLDTNSPEYQSRLAACIACEYLKTIDQGIYCGYCHCPAWRLAELNHKLRYMGYRCPFDR